MLVRLAHSTMGVIVHRSAARFSSTLGFLMGAVLMFASSAAWAGGGRKVPDLRRDTEEWVRPRSAAALRIPVTFHLATDSGASVASNRVVQEWVSRANEELSPFGIEVDVVAVRRMPAGWSEVTHWKSRRALAGHAPHDGTVHVFAIEALDEQGRRARRVRGLHWRYRGLAPGLRGREYLVVTRAAPTTTFAHELGHLFGLRHASRADNIMCSCRRGQAVGFSLSQGATMREGARRLLARQDAGNLGPNRIARRRDRR